MEIAKDFLSKIISHYLVKLTICFVSWFTPTIFIFGSKYMNMLSNAITHVMLFRITVFLAFTLVYLIILFWYLHTQKNKELKSLQVKIDKQNIHEEKKRTEVEYIVGAIKKCRKLVDQRYDLRTPYAFRTTSVYSMLKHYFCDDMIKYIENDNMKSSGKSFESMVFDELRRIEKEYGIV